jgi:hypothetical protein
LAREFNVSLFDSLPQLYSLMVTTLRSAMENNGKAKPLSHNNSASNIHARPVLDLSTGLDEDAVLVSLHLYSLLLPSLSRPLPFQSCVDDMLPLLIGALGLPSAAVRELASVCIASSCALGDTKVCMSESASFSSLDHGSRRGAAAASAGCRSA